MSLQDFAALVAKHATAVRAEYRSLESAVDLAAKHGARSIEDGIREEARRRAIAEAKRARLPS